MSNLFCIYLSSDMFLFMATSYAQWSLKIARLGSLDDSVNGHAEEGKCSLSGQMHGSNGGRMAASEPCYSPVGVCRLLWKQPVLSQHDTYEIAS